MWQDAWTIHWIPLVVCVWLVGSALILGLAMLFHARGERHRQAAEAKRPPAPPPAAYDVAKPGLPDRRREDGPRDVSTRPLHRMVH